MIWHIPALLSICLQEIHEIGSVFQKGMGDSWKFYNWPSAVRCILPKMSVSGTYRPAVSPLPTLVMKSPVFKVISLDVFHLPLPDWIFWSSIPPPHSFSREAAVNLLCCTRSCSFFFSLRYKINSQKVKKANVLRLILRKPC